MNVNSLFGSSEHLVINFLSKEDLRIASDVKGCRENPVCFISIAYRLVVNVEYRDENFILSLRVVSTFFRCVCHCYHFFVIEMY